MGRWALILLLATGCRMPDEPLPGTALVLMSYNIHHGEGTDGVFDLERIAALILEQEPDLVALQEVDVGTSRASGTDQAEELSRMTGMRVAFSQAIPFAGGAYGDAVLSRLPVEKVESFPLPALPDHELRTAAVVTVDAGGRRLRFASTHLDHTSDPVDRVRQAQELVRVLRPDDPKLPPIILAGDLNSLPGSKTIELLERDWFAADSGDQPTFPSGEPERKIDWILLPRATRWLVQQVVVINDPVASDHCGLTATLLWQ